MINVTNLTKEYREILAVDDISFHVGQGEIFGFLGPNGAGKTSTINTLIGLSRPTSGKIIIDGVDAVKDIKKVQAIVGVIPDENNLYGEMTGFDNLCFCASLYGVRKKEREKRAVDLLERFNLTRAGNRLFKTYSKGMKRKLTIAAGIIHNPKILFLDEPTTGIDVESARQIRELILYLKRQGKTIFITTHYIEEAERICDRVAFIVQGRIVKVGTITELMEGLGQEPRIRLKLSDDIDRIKEEIESSFPTYRIETAGKDSCLITSKDSIALSPILQLLDSQGISVYEAREMKPSLEDVFVKTTGIEAFKLKKEKEKGGMGK